MNPSRTPARPRRRAGTLAAVAGVVVLLAACGEPGSAGGSTSGAPTSGAAATCAPVPDEELVVLEDDRSLQTVDNVVPAVNAGLAADAPAVLELLDTVSAALDTDRLIELNRAVDVERRTSAEVAEEFVAAEGLAAEDATVGQGTTVTVGAADFAESATLGTIYASVLTSAGFDASVTTIGNREAYLPALLEGTQVQVVPEYVGTLTEFLNKQANGADAEPLASGDLDATMSELTALGEEVGLAFGEPSPAQDQNAFAVTKAFAEEHGVSTLSELAEACDGLVLGAGPECTERPFCQPGLEETYGLSFAEFRSLDAGGPLTKAALQDGEITLGLVFSSDGALSTS